MDIAMIGLGRMGGNMASRLLRGGHRVVVYNRSSGPIHAAEAEGAEGAESIADVVAKLAAPRAVWLMLPAGDVTEAAVTQLADLLSVGDVIIEGGNSNYKDSMRRAAFLADKGIYMVDSGTSGGIWGLKVGYCIMIGGDAEAVGRLEPIFKTLAPVDGYAHVGASTHYMKVDVRVDGDYKPVGSATAGTVPSNANNTPIDAVPTSCSPHF